MAAIEDWRAAIGRREKIKALKDFLATGGNEVSASALDLQSRVSGGTFTPVDVEVRNAVMSSISTDIAQVINAALQKARDEVKAKALLAKAEAEQIIRDTAP